MANKKGSKPTCLWFTARQGEGDKVSNAHMLTISLTASYLPFNAQVYGQIDAAEELTAKLSGALRRTSYLPQESYSCGVNFVTLKEMGLASQVI